MLDLKLAAIAAAASLCVGAAGGWAVKGWQTGAQLEKKDRETTAMVLDYTKRQADADKQIRASELKWQQERTRIEKEFQPKIAALESDIAGLRLSNDSLRAAAKGFASRTKASIAAKPELSRETASQALDLLTDLLSGSEDRAAEIAAFADRAHTAGLICERQYDSLSANVDAPSTH